MKTKPANHPIILPVILVTALLQLPQTGTANTDLIDTYADNIDQLITLDELTAARQQLAEARDLGLQDENLVILESRLRLLESMHQSSIQLEPAFSGNKHAASQLVNTLREAVESHRLQAVQQVSSTKAHTLALLDALFQQYSAMRVSVTAPQPDNLTGGYTATLEIIELQTSKGDKAFPSPAWSTHTITLTQSNDNNLQAVW